MKDKFSATWVSHSSIGDYLKCPRAYYLRNVYRDPKTNHKITIMSPSLALGQAVHEVIESLSVLPVEERFKEPLINKYEKAWEIVSGKKGGFRDSNEETRFKERGKEMLNRISKNPGPLARKAIKIRDELPYFWLSDEDNIILCGKIDWLEYNPETDRVSIVDFKTGKYDENPDSLQLPIYVLLATNCQKRKVEKAYFWYLDRDNEPMEMLLPDYVESFRRVTEIAKKIQLARKLNHFKCISDEGCVACRPLEQIVSGNAEFVGENDYHADMYVVKRNSVPSVNIEMEADIL